MREACSELNARAHGDDKGYLHRDDATQGGTEGTPPKVPDQHAGHPPVVVKGARRVRKGHKGGGANLEKGDSHSRYLGSPVTESTNSSAASTSSSVPLRRSLTAPSAPAMPPLAKR